MSDAPPPPDPRRPPERPWPPEAPWPPHWRPRWDQRHARRAWEHGGQALFFRFALVFGLLVLLGCAIVAVLGAAAAMLFFVNRPVMPPAIHDVRPVRWLVPLAGLAVVLLLALRLVGRVASRRITRPLYDTLRASAALAAGDLSARVPVPGRGEFRQLALSFNHMAGSLEAADRQRRELLADVAHELRTPLSIIQGNLEGLRDGVYQPTPEHVELVLDETRQLGRLVDDLRLLTLAEARQLPLDRQTMDAAQLLADVREAFAGQADEAGVSVAVDRDGALPVLRGDPQRLGQVLGNLLGNALRYTPPGGSVTLGAAALPDGQGVELWVADTGAGIPAADLPRIFDRFWRGDPARSHAEGAGSGLGLAIAKSLVEAHGGRIWAESRLGQGTRIAFILPTEERQDVGTLER